MNCPKCNCSKSVKSGKIKERQRYKCKDCGCNYTVELKSTAKPESQKRQALHLYLEGLGFRSIGRILGVSNVSVLNWIRDFRKKVQELNSDSQQI
jgi:transposase